MILFFPSQNPLLVIKPNYNIIINYYINILNK